MLDGILNQWLQQKSGHPGGLDFVGYVPFDRESVAKAHLFDVQVRLDELDLLCEGNFRLVNRSQHFSQEFTETED